MPRGGASGGSIRWSSDGSVNAKGWKLCVGDAAQLVADPAQLVAVPADKKHALRKAEKAMNQMHALQ